jgi:arginyl-tRNA synthetase
MRNKTSLLQVLVRYLHFLARTISVALESLSVKHAADPEIAKARLSLFMTARHVLASGLVLLGIEPLSRV